MEKSRIRRHRLVTELSQLFNLETSLDIMANVTNHAVMND